MGAGPLKRGKDYSHMGPISVCDWGGECGTGGTGTRASRAGKVGFAAHLSPMHVFWGTKGQEPDSGTRSLWSLGSPSPVLWKKLFLCPFSGLITPCSIPGKPSKGSAIQLPGKVFTHFQDWNTDLYSRDRQQRSLSTYYCHSFFDAITAGGCWSV